MGHADAIRRDLNRRIWLGLRRDVTYGDEHEAIRIMRAQACKAVTTCTRGYHQATSDYKALTIAELRAVLDYITHGTLPRKTATKRQIEALKAIALRAACLYLHHNDEFPQDKGQVYAIYRDVINPLSCRWLAEGGYPPRTFIDYSSLRSDEAAYLIQRYRRMIHNLLEKHATTMSPN